VAKPHDNDGAAYMRITDVLVTGGDGQLGRELRRCPLPAGWRLHMPDRSSLDLSDRGAIAKVMAARQWGAVINAAAFTAVDMAETDVAAAWEINALAPAALAEACARIDIPILYVSTDYVFSGDRPGAWSENDPVRPIGVYGASKLGGELAVRTSGARHAILRTSWVISAHRNNFLKTMLRLATDRDTVRVVADQHGRPTAAADLARAVFAIAGTLVDHQTVINGTFHFANDGVVNWADFAREIFRQSALRGGPSAQVESIGTADYPTPARRPANSVLDTSAIGTAFGIVPRPWTEAVADILDELIGVVQ